MITKQQVENAQNTWADGVVKIGSLKENRSECEAFTNKFLDDLYAFELGPVSFKPTKCAIKQFRPTKPEALSYFIAGNNRACEEDKGFAIQPWTKVRFENADIILNDATALAMGNYFFTSPEGDELKVEYTFGYMVDVSGNLRIQLHHSSMPAIGD